MMNAKMCMVTSAGEVSRLDGSRGCCWELLVVGGESTGGLSSAMLMLSEARKWCFTCLN